MKRRHLLQLGGAAALLSLFDRAGIAADATPAFGPSTTAEEVTAGLDLSGMTILITGTTSGIGLEMMRVLALRGAHVIGTGRNAGSGASLLEGKTGRVTMVTLDLADFASVRACAAQVRELTPQLDAIVCNAGIVLGDWQQVNGIERQFVVNHLGHFLLVNGLLEQVTSAPQGRIVVIGSGDHRRAPPGGIQFDRLSGEGWHDRGYAHSKLANGLFALELSQRLRGTRATANCVTPGHTRTNILRNVGNRYGEHARSVEQGAATPCHAAVHPAMGGVTGQFLRDFQPAEQSAEQQDRAMARRLWEVSAALTA